MRRAACHQSEGSRGRDYEREFADALTLLDYKVVLYPAWKKDAAHKMDARVVVAQYMPKPYDPAEGKERAYKCDFCHVPTLCNAEIDGFAGANGARVGGHTNWAGFHRDRYRDRLLLMEGWRILRFGPADLRGWADVLKAADDFIRLIRLVEKGCNP